MGHIQASRLVLNIATVTGHTASGYTRISRHIKGAHTPSPLATVSKNIPVQSHLNVKAELLKAFEQSLLVAGHKSLQVRVDS